MKRLLSGPDDKGGRHWGPLPQVQPLHKEVNPDPLGAQATGGQKMEAEPRSLGAPGLHPCGKPRVR